MNNKNYLPIIHGLQDCDSKLLPVQFLPPIAGAGLLQVLECVWLPPPQVIVQESHGDQSDHPPSANREKS